MRNGYAHKCRKYYFKNPMFSAFNPPPQKKMKGNILYENTVVNKCECGLKSELKQERKH